MSIDAIAALLGHKTLQAQRDDAQNKGQIARQKIFDGLLERLDHDAS